MNEPYEIMLEELGTGVRFSLREHGREVGHAYLYVLKNDLHDRPFGFMEDVFVDEGERGRGGGTLLTNAVITEVAYTSAPAPKNNSTTVNA